MASGKDQGSDVGKGDAGNQVVPFQPGAKTKAQGYKTWDHKRLSASPFNFSWIQPQKGQPAPPPIVQDDPKLANWKPSEGMPEDEVFCRQDGQRSGCPGCLAFSTKGKKTGKKCSSNVLTVNGMPVPACPKKKLGRKRIKSKREYLTGEDPEGWKTSWFPVMSHPALTCTTACEKSPKKRPKRQNEPSVPKPAPKPAPQQPLQPLNVEATVEQQVQQSYGASAPEPVPEPAPEPALVSALEQSHASDIESTASGTKSTASDITNLIRAKNVPDFEDAFRNTAEAEPLTKPPIRPLIQPTKPGLGPEVSANAETSQGTKASNDLMQMESEDKVDETLTPAEQEVVLTLVNDFFMQ